MRPTVGEQLVGARRLMELVAADPGLSDQARAHLADVARLVRRAERSWAGGPAFLAADNRATDELLGQLAGRLPDGLAAAIRHERATATEHRHEADARNQRLRGLLAEAVPHLDGDGHRLVVAHLRRRLDADAASRRGPRSNA